MLHSCSPTAVRLNCPYDRQRSQYSALRAPIAVMLATAALCSPGAATSAYDGLYYPSGTKEPSSCSRIEQEIHPGGMIIENGSIYSEDLVCELGQGEATGDGFRFDGSCELEGTSYRETIDIRETTNGIEISTVDSREDLTLCIDAQNTSTATGSNWVSGFAMGVSEVSVSNGNGTSIIFSCSLAGDLTEANVYFETDQALNGKVAMVVDGEGFNFTATESRVRIDERDEVNAKRHSALLTALFGGETLTVLSGSTQAYTFGISGAAVAFGKETCFP